MRIFRGIDELIGGTPLMLLTRLMQVVDAKAEIYAKLEMLNPAGSAKDRAARGMLNAAEKQGLLAPGATIVEPTSGNTGIALAAVGIPRGYTVILTMPDTMSRERVALLRAYGAKVLLTDGKLGMAGAVEKAKQLLRDIPNAYMPGQFDNPENARAHEETTGPEIARDLDGHLDAFLACFGTGGTVSGTGKYLKENVPGVRVFAVEPASSPLLTQGRSGAHKIQGIGANFVPSIFNRGVIDEVLTVSDEDAYRYTRLIARTEGLLAGISSGAAACAAAALSKRPEMAGKRIVTLFPDTGERYLSTGVFDD